MLFFLEVSAFFDKYAMPFLKINVNTTIIIIIIIIEHLAFLRGIFRRAQHPTHFFNAQNVPLLELRMHPAHFTATKNAPCYFLADIFVLPILSLRPYLTFIFNLEHYLELPPLC